MVRRVGSGPPFLIGVADGGLEPTLRFHFHIGHGWRFHGLRKRYASRLEMRLVAGYDCHAVHECRSGDQSVPIGLRIWHMQARAAPGDGCFDFFVCSVGVKDSV